MNARVVSALIGGSPVSGFGFSGNQLITIPNAIDLPFGQTLTLTISGIATNSVMPADTFENTSTVTYTSINDAVGTSSNADERNGSGSPDPTSLNNYFDTAASPVVTVCQAFSTSKNPSLIRLTPR